MDDLLVIGGGIMGLATAWEATRRGMRVTLVDERPLVNEHSASNDESKVFRFAYAEDAEYVPLAQEALAGWRALEAESGARLLHQSGLVMFGAPGGYHDRSADTLERLALPVERVDAAGCRARWPALATEAAVVDPHGGWLDPRAAMHAFEAGAVRRGARVLRDARAMRVEDGRAWLADGRTLTADAVVACPGFHVGELFPEVGKRVRVTRQPELFFAGDVALPVFAALEEGFYGFPASGGAVKVADHRKGPVVTDYDHRPPPTDEELAQARRWLARRIPALAEAPLARSRVCLYDNTVDDRFILERAPGCERVVVGAGFSGHGFKFAPALGRVLVDLARR